MLEFLLAKSARVRGREPASAPLNPFPQGASVRVLAEETMADFPIVVEGVIAARDDHLWMITNGC